MGVGIGAGVSVGMGMGVGVGVGGVGWEGCFWQFASSKAERNLVQEAYVKLHRFHQARRSFVEKSIRSRRASARNNGGKAAKRAACNRGVLPGGL